MRRFEHVECTSRHHFQYIPSVVQQACVLEDLGAVLSLEVACKAGCVSGVARQNVHGDD